MDGFRCEVLSHSHVHSTGFVVIFFNGISKREVRMRFAGIHYDVQERQRTQQINPRSGSAELEASAVRCSHYLWPGMFRTDTVVCYTSGR
jgi:hypothetical protein